MRWRSQPPVPPAAFCVQVRSLGNFEPLRVEYFLTIRFSEISLSPEPVTEVTEGWQTGQHYLALQFGCECELRPDCSKAVPVEKLCFLPIELALLRNDKN